MKQELSKEQIIKDYLSIKKQVEAGFYTGDRGVFKATVDTITGFLTAPVKLARIGVQHYMGFELGLTDRAVDKIGVFRSPEEVFHPESIKSFTNLVATDNHPTDLVDVDNVKELQVGTVSEVDKDTDVLTGIVTITDKTQISKAEGGKIEVSVGYTNDLKEQKGTHNGVEYEFVQTKIRANHLAIVDAGRCGPECKITMDNKKEKCMKVTVDGIEFDTDNQQLVQAIQKQQSTNDAEKEGFKKKLDEEEEEKKKMGKEKDKAEAAKDALEKSTLDAAGMDKLIADRASLIAEATSILKDKMLECTDCPREIKAAVIDKVLDIGDVSGKSDDYIDASYDIAIKKVKDSKESIDKLNSDFTIRDAGAGVTRESARAKYMKDMGMEV